VNIIAPAESFLREYGFTLSAEQRKEKWSYRPPPVETRPGADSPPPVKPK
jgi:hypothetical protein